ncbi:hypothetical protein B0A48_12668 [Cryoendolithus antarcticus]|uniref:SEC7 domain-containing protein n=1 Tax=Cryoendolithus antarcticus TaxID=1507870 RepID=A0A1V8SRW8_9PEZI|nr:hypothetical protein B0A48_12668 [Cryoendolithus antarcticus]
MADSSSQTSPGYSVHPGIATRSSSKNVLRGGDGKSSPPSTPRNPPRRVKKSKAPAHTQSRAQEGINWERSLASDPRHSHGLSWSSTTRDSVVDNLLQSLDGLSSQMRATFESTGAQFDDFEERQRERDRIRQAPLHAADRPAQRPRGHTYSSSLSSDLTSRIPEESPSSNFSSPPYRSRRSNSSSNVATHIPAQKSGRAPTSRYSQLQRNLSSDTSRGAHSVLSHRQLNGQSRDEGKTSFESQGYDAVKESGRLAWGGVGRSVSMDHIYADANTRVSSVMERGRPVPSAFSSYEVPSNAAPEPMIPAGPRKMQNPNATGPVYVNQATKGSALRKITTQSDLRSASTPMIPQDVRDRASDFVRNNSMQGNPVVPPVGERAVSTSISGGGRARDALSPHRERQGFFKRVFGGSSRTNERPVSPHGAPDAGKENKKPSVSTTNMTSSNLKNEVQQLPNSTAVTTVSYPPVALNKKPSSFFRRRKKSASDNSLPPPLPLHLDQAKLTPAQPSPSASSLRKVMDPFLRDEDTSATMRPPLLVKTDSRPDSSTSHTGDSDSLDIFHSGYTPPPDASLGKRNPFSREPTGARPSQDSDGKLRVKVKKKKPEPIVASATSNDTDRQNSQPSGVQPDLMSPATFYSPMEKPQRRVSPMSSEAMATSEQEQRPVSRASTGDRILASAGVSPVEPSQEMRDFAAGNNLDLHMQESSWSATQSHQAETSREANGPTRLFLQPSVDDLAKIASRNTGVSPQSSKQSSRSASVNMPGANEQAPPTPSTRYHSATSLPLVQMDGNDLLRPSLDAYSMRSSSKDSGDASKERAKRIFDGDEDDVTQMEAASWLGENKTLNQRTLAAYMLMWDFTGMNVLAALRALCGKLVLKGETQQFDRIITALSSRWCECNPNHGFKAQDVVHTMLYSLILLNTDLHMADIGDKMSKSAYVKNTLPTIRRVVSDAAPGAFDETLRPATNGQTRAAIPWPEANSSGPNSPALPPDTPQERTSFDLGARPNATKRLSIRPGMFRGESDGFTPDSANSSSSNALVNSQFSGNMRAWEFEVEVVLKSFWNSIKGEPLPLLSLSVADVRSSERNLAPGGLKRSGSVASRAPSEAASYRSKPGLRNLSMGWQGRNTRSRPKMYNPSTVGSSRTSFDDDSSMWSGVQSSTWSSKNSYGKTLASSSVGSLGHFFSPSDASYKHSIGFANALSQAIIREEGVANGVDNDSITIKGDLLEDESLTLEGAPWAKEGIVKQRHEFEATDRKAKDRTWSSDFFAVISKGKLTLFNFNTTTTKSRSLGRQRLQKTAFGSKAASIASTQVGGGDWMGNAEQIASFALRHTVAVTLPSGYNKHRYVWALRLPGGACHLFDVGTPEIAVEWVSTANYWAARLSKEPLSGGVSNIEYGWSEQVINTSLIGSAGENVSTPPSAMGNRARTHTHSSSTGNNALPRPSMQSSLRGSFDLVSTGGGTRGPKLAGDKAQLADWKQPSPSMMASQLMEVDQMKTMVAYVANAEKELEEHNELKNAIELAYSPHTHNYRRALANWQHKSEYLLREIVKFRTYIESLAAAMKARDEVLAKREAAKNGGGRVAASQLVEEKGNDTTPRQSRIVGA